MDISFHDGGDYIRVFVDGKEPKGTDVSRIVEALNSDHVMQAIQREVNSKTTPEDVAEAARKGFRDTGHKK